MSTQKRGGRADRPSRLRRAAEMAKRAAQPERVKPLTQGVVLTPEQLKELFS